MEQRVTPILQEQEQFAKQEQLKPHKQDKNDQQERNLKSDLTDLVVNRNELPGIRARRRLMQRLREIQIRRLERELKKCQEKQKI